MCRTSSKPRVWTFDRHESAELTIAGQKRQAVSWHLEKAQMELVADAETSRPARMHLPQQKTTVELADESVVKLVGKSRAEELLANLFIQSNVTFDDFMKVTRLEATVDVEVIGSGVGNDVTVLTTGMQTFDGEKKGSGITGTVVVKSVDYDGSDSPAVSCSGFRCRFSSMVGAICLYRIGSRIDHRPVCGVGEWCEYALGSGAAGRAVGCTRRLPTRLPTHRPLAWHWRRRKVIVGPIPR